MITYSFIIPHKNTPELLLRCIESIPLRQDVQIIVVDDNSDEEKKPKGLDQRVQVVLLSQIESKGAGHARNVGMSYAKGDWLLFPDADDFYTNNFLEILDGTIKSSNAQILYFSCMGVETSNLKPHPCANGVQKYIEQFDGSKRSLDIVKYKTHVPWCKALRRDFVMKYALYYDEVQKGNDVKFSYLTAFFAPNVKVIKNRLYVYTFNPESITHSQRSLAGSLSILANQAKSKVFLKHIGLAEMHNNIPIYNTSFAVLKHQGIFTFILFMYELFFHRKNIFCSQFDYISTMETIKLQQLIKGHTNDNIEKFA